MPADGTLLSLVSYMIQNEKFFHGKDSDFCFEMATDHAIFVGTIFQMTEEKSLNIFHR